MLRVGDKAIVKSEANHFWAKFGVGDVVKVNSDGATLDVAFRGDAVREIFSADYICGQFNAEHLWKLI
jgi:hypothetical protein